LCVKISNDVSLKDGSFVALGAVAIQGIRRANLTLGEKVAVIGLGLIGQITVQILKAYGFSVVGFDVDGEKVKKCLNFKMDQGGVVGKADIKKIIKDFTNDIGLDAVMITASSKSNEPLDLAGEILRERGRVSIIGDFKIEIPRRTYYKKEIDVFLSRSYGPGRYDREYEEKGIDYPVSQVRWTEKRNMEEFIRLIEKKIINPELLVTHTFKIDDAKNAYDLILKNNGKEDVGAIIFSYDEKKQNENIIILDRVGREAVSNKVQIGIIGAGNFSQGIILPALKNIDEARIYAIADSDGEKAERVCSKYKGVYATTDYRKILDDKDINLAIVATRHSDHAEMALEFLKKNKNVHVEKPLAVTPEELKTIIQTAKNSKGNLMVGYNRRFSESIIKTKEFIEQEDFPLIMTYRINAGFIPFDNWVQDKKEGGRIVGEVCHFVDLLQFLAGSKPKRIYATLAKTADQKSDSLISVIDFDNGSCATIIYSSLGNVNVPKEYIEVFGGNKAVVINDFKEMKMIKDSTVKEIKKFNQDKGHKNGFLSFIKAIKSGSSAPISLQEIFYSSQATFAILDSIKENRPIEL